MSRTTFANLNDGLQLLSLFDEAFNPTPKIVTSGNYTADGTENRIFINKGTGSPTAVLMNSASTLSRLNLEILIKDIKGDAATNNITITDANGATFDGLSSLVIDSNYGFYWIKAYNNNWITI